MTRNLLPEDVIASPEVLAIANLVPGAEMLGYGFNIFRSYSFDAAIRPLMQLGTPGEWTAPSGKTYDLPANVSTPGGSSSSASASTFKTSSEFNDYFKTSASVSGSTVAFSAGFKSSYDTAQQNSNTYSWALVEANFISWHVDLKYAANILLQEIATDPDWLALPKTFLPQDRTNVLAFYRFFQKFGTHFINQVMVGGALYYYFCVSKSASLSSTDIATSATAEYRALISKGAAEAKADWGRTAKNWVESRQTHAVTVPATTGVINWVNPPVDSYDQNGNFAEWQTEVLANPSRCKFSLTPIWDLFSGDQWTALQLAYAAYASNGVSVRADTERSMATILVDGTPLVPSGGYPTKANQYWQLCVLDRQTLNVDLNKIYDFGIDNWVETGIDAIYKGMANDLQPYVGLKDKMLIAATSYMNIATNPTAEVYAILRSFGAGPGLDLWMARLHGCQGSNVVYALVGAGVYNSGLEKLGSRNLELPTTIEIDALLLPAGDNFSPLPYQP